MLNSIVIHGRLTADPELKQTQSQVAKCTFTVAVDRSYKQGDEKLNSVKMSYREAKKFAKEQQKKAEKEKEEGTDSDADADADSGAAEEAESEGATE